MDLFRFYERLSFLKNEEEEAVVVVKRNVTHLQIADCFAAGVFDLEFALLVEKYQESLPYSGSSSPNSAFVPRLDLAAVVGLSEVWAPRKWFLAD